MTRKILISLFMLGTVVMGGLFALGAIHRWNDPHHCWGWTPGKLLDGPGGQSGEALPMSKQPESFRAAVDRCVQQRRAHRSGPLGAFRTRGDRAALSCERRWSSFEDWLRQGNPVAAHGVALSYGITDRLDPASPGDRERFMESCVPIRARELRQRGSD